MEIKGFDPRDLKMCHVATLADLGYRTTVTVANGFTGGRVPRDDVDVSLEVRDPEGDPIFARDLMSIVPGEYAVVDLSRELDLQGVETSRDVLATIRLRPARYRGCGRDRCIGCRSHWPRVGVRRVHRVLKRAMECRQRTCLPVAPRQRLAVRGYPFDADAVAESAGG